MSVILVIIGVVLLYLGGDLLVRNASRLAFTLGVTPMVIGLTVVAFGTSSPELAATLVSAFRGVPEVALGNIVGSNIANIGLILGLTALIYPLQTGAKFLYREVPFMVLVGALLFPLLFDDRVTWLEGAILLTILGFYLWYQFRSGEAVVVEARLERADETRAPLWRSIVGAAIGIGLLVVGAQALVEGAVALARGFGIPERVIGLTLVAIGTSLPELASSLVASLKRETDIILGNIIGSNIFNVLAILGATALIHPLHFSYASLQFDLIVMLALSLLVTPLMLRRARLGRSGGSFLLCLYVLYILVLFGYLR